MIYILVSRDTKTGNLDARLFPSRERLEAFREDWKRDPDFQPEGRVEFKTVIEAGVRV